jgi:hypothetical protein
MVQFSRTMLAYFPMLNNLHPELFLNFNSLISAPLRVIFAMMDSIVTAAIGLSDTLRITRQSKPGSIIELSFRTLQAQRIEALQKELLDLSLLDFFGNASAVAAKSDEQRIAQIDTRLHAYGVKSILVLRL